MNVPAISPGRIPLAEPLLTGEEAAYLADCIANNWLAAGPYVERFEARVAQAVQVPHAVACASGTAALHVALRVAGIQPGDLVCLPALTFIAPANAVRYLNAEPVLLDVEPARGELDPERLDDFLTERCRPSPGGAVHRETGRTVRAVIAVHLLGHPVDMDPVIAIARRHGLVVIEDAAESLGSRYRGKSTGSLGDIACFSFNGNKIITSAGGGMIVTSRSDWADRARHLVHQARIDATESIHDTVGYNYRLSNPQAAIGLAQIEHLADYLEKKRHIARRYRELLADVPGIELSPAAEWGESNCWLNMIRIDPAAYGMDRRELAHRLAASGIETRPLWQPLVDSPAHAGALHEPAPCARSLQASALCLPSSVGLTESDQSRVGAMIRRRSS